MKMTFLPPSVINYRWIDTTVDNYRCKPTQLKKKALEKTPTVVNYSGAWILPIFTKNFLNPGKNNERESFLNVKFKHDVISTYSYKINHSVLL